MAKKLLSGWFGFIKDSKAPEGKRAVIFYSKDGVRANAAPYSIDNQQYKPACRRFNEGDYVRFSCPIPFVAKIDGIKFEVDIFKKYYHDKMMEFTAL